MQFSAEKNGKQTADTTMASLTRFSTSSFIDEKACLLAFQNEEEVLWPFAFFPVQKSATNLQALVQQTFIDLSNPALEPLKERMASAFNPDLMAFKGLGFLYQLRHHRKAGNKKPPQKQLQGNEEMKGFMFHHVKAMVSVFYVTQCIFW